MDERHCVTTGGHETDKPGNNFVKRLCHVKFNGRS